MRVARWLFTKRRVKIDAFAAAGFGEQHFGVEPRIVGAVLSEILHRPRQQAADGPGLVGSGHGGRAVER